MVHEGAKRTDDWKHTFFFSTDTGDWVGLAQSYDSHDRAPIGFYRDCLAWRVGAAQRVEAIALLAPITDHDIGGIVHFE